MIIPVVAATDERDDSVMQAVSDNGARQGRMWGHIERKTVPARKAKTNVFKPFRRLQFRQPRRIIILHRRKKEDGERRWKREKIRGREREREKETEGFFKSR